MKKRIAYFFWNLCIGGNENAALRLMRGLSKKNWKIWILSYYQADHIKGDVENFITNFACMKQFPEGESAVDQVVEFIKMHDISILHIIWGDYRIAKSIKERKLDIHTVASTTNAFPECEARMRLGTYIESMQVPHRNDVAIVEQKDPTLKGRVVSIENGVDVERFDRKHLSETKIAALKKEMRLDGCQVIGTVGNVRPAKNQKLLISMLHELKKYNDNIKLVILGDILVKDEYLSLKETIDKLSLADSVIFTGFQFDVRPYIELFDVYILSSLGTESCPNAVLEAMSMEKPIIATDNVGLDGVIESGVNGYILNQDNVFEMCRHIKNLLMSPTMLAHYGAASRKIVESKYTLEKMIANYETWYVNR